MRTLRRGKDGYCEADLQEEFEKEARKIRDGDEVERCDPMRMDMKKWNLVNDPLIWGRAREGVFHDITTSRLRSSQDKRYLQDARKEEP